MAEELNYCVVSSPIGPLRLLSNGNALVRVEFAGKHGIRIEWRLRGNGEVASKGSFMVEKSTAAPREHAAPMTEHSAGELGPVALSVVGGGRQLNFYPLLAEGINELHRHLREQGLGGGIDYPGRIRYDEDSRQLAAGTLPPDSR